MTRAPVLIVDDRGLYCPKGDFHIDPWRPVARAVTTHAHSDHARGGSAAYLATSGTAAMLRHRLGAVQVQTLDWGVPLAIGGATVSLHPSGHLPGAAQVRVEVAGEVWVVSGDYKTEADGLAEAWAPVACHGFITECTFGLPVYRWAPQSDVAADIMAWWHEVAAAGDTAVIGAYSLGKAQRLLHLLAAGGPGPLLVHPVIAASSEALVCAGYRVPRVPVLTPGAAVPQRALVLAPPQTTGAIVPAGGGRLQVAAASGWMALRGTRRRRGGGTGFTLSDHADWPGLNAAVEATGATSVRTTHGYAEAFARWLASRGLDARELGAAPAP
ncbi:MAG: ligase-associated DNA damage response exonuclease [Gemmobacter sp.]|nr:ligase-associated DNA damage response exonuclease [Gemmobacter sp.]